MKSVVLLVISVVIYVSSAFCATNISLDGEWKFAVDSSGVYKIETLDSTAYWRTAVVPLSWQEQFPDLRRYQGVAWYEKGFTLPRLKKDEVVVLHFGAVDYMAKVYVNGKSAGEHEGGYLPFDLDITSLVNDGTNIVVVRVMDPSTSKEGTEGVLYSQIPHGKQSWYIQTSGLWQSVSLSIKPSVYLRQVHVTPSIDGKISIEALMSEPAQNLREEKYSVTVFDPSMNESGRLVRSVPAGSDSINVSLALKDPLLWSPDSPNLYTLRIVMADGDTSVEKFGFRSFETENGKFILNGKPVYLMGALDQDFYPETGYTPPSADYIRDEMLKAKMLGLNLLRCHIKVPDPRYLEIADEVGMLVWYEIPNWDDFTQASSQRAIETFDGMIARDWNHPSIVIISIINESWGIDLKDSTERLWLKNTYDYAKSKAVGRLIEDNSPCCDNFHMKSDIADWHTYWAIPENMKNFRSTVIGVASRPDWLFSRSGDAVTTGEEPLMISEFGNWGLPMVPDTLPWWLRKPFGWGFVEPEGVHERFREYQLDSLFANYDSLAAESQRSQFEALKYEIEEIRLQPQIQGYVVTEFTDINWECNGLMDIWRHPKIYAKQIGEIQQQDLVIPRTDKYNYRSGETATVRLWISHYGDESLAGGWIDWKAGADGGGRIAIPDIAAAGVTEIAPLSLHLPETDSPVVIELKFDLKNSSGKKFAGNFTNIFLFPATGAAVARARTYDPDSALLKLDREFPLVDSGTTSRGPVILTDVLDSTVMNNLQDGSNVVCFVDDTTRIPSGFPFQLVSRDTGGYDGNWVSNLNWVRRSGPFAGLSFGGHLGFESADISPKYVLAGLDGKYFSDAYAGMFVGWVHLNSVYVLQMRVGKGKLIICTLPLAGAIDRDPYSRTLLAHLVNYVDNVMCEPSLKISER